MTHVPYPGCYCADCVEGPPSARITGDKDRENPVEGAPRNPYRDLYARTVNTDDLIIGGQLGGSNRTLAAECYRLRTVLQYIADVAYVDHQSGNANFEYLQGIARDGLSKGASHDADA